MRPSRQNNPKVYTICILTVWGKAIGMGHLQRMMALTWFLNTIRSINAYLVLNSIPPSFPEELKPFLISKIIDNADLIIRDSRDSSIQEMTRLKKTARVLAIDDLGSGREFADFAVDLLPNPKNINYNFFLYGYDFIKSLNDFRGKTITKNIDFSLYPGVHKDNDYVDFLLSLLPGQAVFSVLRGKDSYIQTGSKIIKSVNMPIAEILLSSRAVISHFGLTLYEGYISGCKTISINPSEYHDTLSNIAKEKIGLLNLGLESKINKEPASALIAKIYLDPIRETIDGNDVYVKAVEKIEKFSSYLINLINGVAAKSHF